MNIQSFLLVSLEVGLLSSLLAVLVERALIIMGCVRGNTIALLIVTILLALFKEVLDPSGSIYVYAVFAAIIGPIAANRYDLTSTIQKGRCWWKKSDTP
jgi:hypothetical protein